MAAPAPTPKPKAGALPPWAWLAAGAVGLVIGIVFLRNSGSAAAAAEGEPARAGSPGSAEEEGGGAIALPPELLAALGLRPSGTYEGGQTGGDSGGAAAGSGAGSEGLAAAVSTSTAPAAGWDYYVAAGQTNAQLPAGLQLAGVAPSAPVISSYFDTPQTIRGPGNVPVISTVQPPKQLPALGGSSAPRVYAI